MSTTTTNRRRQTVKANNVKESPLDALARIEAGYSANDEAVVIAFAAAGLDPADIDPRHNVLTFNAWKAKGRQVAKGATSVRVTVWIPVGKSDGPATPLADGQPAENGGRRSRLRPTTARLFHESQTIAIGAPTGTWPDAWHNPALIKRGTYELEIDPQPTPTANSQRTANLFAWPTGDSAPQLLTLAQFAAE